MPCIFQKKTKTIYTPKPDSQNAMKNNKLTDLIQQNSISFLHLRCLKELYWDKIIIKYM